MLELSKYVRHLEAQDGDIVAWHSLFGNPQCMTKEIWQRLSNLPTKKGDVDENVILEYFVGENFLVDDKSESDFERRRWASHNTAINVSAASGDKVRALSLIMCEECNFRCKYCIHFGNLSNSDRINSPEKFMSFKLAYEVIKGYFSKYVIGQNRQEAYVNFGGGEPLLNWPVVKECIKYIRFTYGDVDVTLGVNTNLSLLTSEMADFFVENNVYVAMSLDGLKPHNDSVRLTKNLTGTFDTVVDKINLLNSKGYRLDGFAMTVTADNFDGIDVSLIDWAEKNGMSEVRIDIDVIGLVDIPLSEIVAKLSHIRKYAAKKGINVIGFWSRPAENMGEDPMSGDTDVAFCGAVRGSSLCVSPSGNVYPCGYSNCKIGDLANFYKITSGSEYLEFIRKPDSIPLCIGCEIEGFCGGGCHITHENDLSDKISRMCDLYRGMTHEILLDSASIT